MATGGPERSRPEPPAATLRCMSEAELLEAALAVLAEAGTPRGRAGAGPQRGGAAGPREPPPLEAPGAAAAEEPRPAPPPAEAPGRDDDLRYVREIFFS
ncbi:cell cycle regulator of non-homologous end joining-like [Cuculus canorus]|uniref:cell cycle regulator of non-homologous end joining-like n=1 Tax=Cuculus canorus TaxID=55661 RepID=UPI0023AA43DF|nr:cell cycle regulator of non-homologous end joining-like [Cuculus canorus]